ncbi:MAG TPA: SWIM zinc finger family protein [Candidatus Limnocylindrales bacterium]|nr:SWIM zinc finger family protein [Candidatus Limnocylindrales bacterium]
MALAAPALEQAYRYPFPSALVGSGPDRRLRLATSGGPAANPQFFRGTLPLPVVASDLLLTVGDVARARFHVPPAMLARILLLADPVATCADERLRFEAFSACCSVYGRADFLPDGFDGEIVGRGTTNVDMGADLRAALAGVQDGSSLGLAVGASSVEVVADGASAVERRIPLPSRWVRGFLEIQAIQAELAPVATLDGAGARAFLRSIPKSRPKGPVWLAPSGTLRISHHDPGGGAVAVAGLGRLRLLERVARHASALRLYALPGEGSTGWQLDVPGGRLTLLLSPDVWRGFSGEGRALHRLADAASAGSVAAVRGALGWEPRLNIDGLAATTGESGRVVGNALAALAVSGIVGYDLADGGFFRRELPFSFDRGERLQPRLRDARRLLERSAVRVETADADVVVAWVAGADGVEYRVRSSADGWSCTCPWFGRHRGDRGPCKHVLAVQLAAADAAD